MEAAVVNDDRDGWSRADSQYHEIITSACPNRLLGELSLQIRNRISFIAIDMRTSSERLAACTLEHRRIVEQMAQRDGDGAAEAMRTHIDQLWQSTVRKFNHR
jgi:GntR family transcriptional repressor for pyruvate dehydrogenase complex